MKTDDYVVLAATLDAMADLSMDMYGREFKTMRDAAKALRDLVQLSHTLMRDVQTTLGVLADRTVECESLRAQLSEAQARLAAWPASKESLKGERELAEYAYSVTALDFERNPIGSRDWTLFWSGWQRNNEARNEAAPAAPAAQAADHDVIVADDGRVFVPREMAHLYAKPAAQVAQAVADARCPHGIRYPHPCSECEASVPGSTRVCEACGGHGCSQCEGGFVNTAPAAPAAQATQPVSDAYKSSEQAVADDVVRDAITHCATLAHMGGMKEDALNILCAIRKITLPWFDGNGTQRQCEQRVTRAMIFAAQQQKEGK